MTERILYQFPISHYCEKARWQLDHKGLAYRTRNLLPGLQIRTVSSLFVASRLRITRTPAYHRR